MNPTALALLAAVSVSMCALGQEWPDRRVFEVRKLPPRSPAWPKPDAASGCKSNYDTSPWVVSLNGM